jgi:PKHD-type hydroxylase
MLPPAGKRSLTVVAMLTDPEEYEGGYFNIKATSSVTRLERSQGSVFLFPSYVLHQVEPVTKGVVCVCVCVFNMQYNVH